MQLLDWTGRQLAQGKKGRIPDALFGAGFPTPPEPILQRLQLDRNGWCDRVAHFGRLLFVVAGAPATIDDTTSRINQHRCHVPAGTRQLYRDVESRKASTAQRSVGVIRFTTVDQPTVLQTLIPAARHHPNLATPRIMSVEAGRNPLKNAAHGPENRPADFCDR